MKNKRFSTNPLHETGIGGQQGMGCSAFGRRSIMRSSLLSPEEKNGQITYAGILTYDSEAWSLSVH